MPEFESLLSFGQKLRLAVGLRRPHVIGQLMAEVASDRRYDRAEIMRIYRMVEEAIEEHYGAAGLDQFRRSFDRYVK